MKNEKTERLHINNFLRQQLQILSQEKNVLKTKKAVRVTMLDAGCQLMAIFKENVNATRKLSQ